MIMIMDIIRRYGFEKKKSHYDRLGRERKTDKVNKDVKRPGSCSLRSFKFRSFTLFLFADHDDDLIGLDLFFLESSRCLSLVSPHPSPDFFPSVCSLSMMFAVKGGRKRQWQGHLFSCVSSSLFTANMVDLMEQETRKSCKEKIKWGMPLIKEEKPDIVSRTCLLNSFFRYSLICCLTRDSSSSSSSMKQKVIQKKMRKKKMTSSGHLIISSSSFNDLLNEGNESYTSVTKERRGQSLLLFHWQP